MDDTNKKPLNEGLQGEQALAHRAPRDDQAGVGGGDKISPNKPQQTTSKDNKEEE